MAQRRFFELMRVKYGRPLVKQMKDLFKLKLKLAKAENKKLFLLRCRKLRVFSRNKLLKNSCNINPIVFRRLETQFIFGVMNQEIAENFLRMKKLNKRIEEKLQRIKQTISSYYFRNFMSRLESSFQKRYDYFKANNIRKFNNVLENNIVVNQNYSSNNDNQQDVTNVVNNEFSDVGNNNNNDKWLVNLSNTQIPNTVRDVLKLGNKFCPPISNKSIPYVQIIAKIEGCLIDITNENSDKQRLRNDVVNILTNFKHKNRHTQFLTPPEVAFTKDVAFTKNFIKEHVEILITKADKGNTTVIVDKSDYISKMSSMLEDTRTYQLIDKDTTTTIQSKLNKMVTTWHTQNRITIGDAKYLKSYHGVCAKLYGLPKIHKLNTPYRPIVSSIGTPLYNLSVFLAKILNNTVGKSASSIKNSGEFKAKIKHFILPTDYVVLSLDVVSLFTNVDTKLVLELLGKQWDEIKINSGVQLTKTQYIAAMELVLNNCEFSFNDKIYRQLFGCPMGSPVSPAVADLVMEFIESNVLGALDFKPVFYFRYVDDIVTAIPRNKIDIFIEAFNAFNNHIKFTIELENEQKLAFLDLNIVHNIDGTLITDWYHKPSWSGRYLNYNSNLPLSYKRNTVKLLCNKIFELSDPIFHQENFKLLKQTLLINNYPESFIDTNFKCAYRKHSSVVMNTESIEVIPISDTNVKYISIPYIKSLHEKLSSCLKKYNFKLIGKAYNHLGQSVFSSLKDATKLGNNKDVVYKVVCECDKMYIGQTSQLLSTRLYQHKRDAQMLTTKKVNHDATSALSAHLFETKHNIYIDNIKILEREPNLSTRRVLEMIHIKKNPRSINKQSDCYYLQNNYDNLL